MPSNSYHHNLTHSHGMSCYTGLSYECQHKRRMTTTSRSLCSTSSSRSSAARQSRWTLSARRCNCSSLLHHTHTHTHTPPIYYNQSNCHHSSNNKLVRHISSPTAEQLQHGDSSVILHIMWQSSQTYFPWVTGCFAIFASSPSDNVSIHRGEVDNTLREKLF